MTKLRRIIDNLGCHINWEMYAKLSGVYIPDWDNYDEIETETSSSEEEDSLLYRDPFYNPRYNADCMKQELRTMEWFVEDMVSMIVLKVGSFMKKLYYEKGEDTDKKDKLFY